MTLHNLDPIDTPALFGRVHREPAQAVTMSLVGRRCCLLTALWLDRMQPRDQEFGDIARATMSRDLGFPADFTSGLIFGWDGFLFEDLPRSAKVKDHDAWRDGNLLGRRAWHECLVTGIATEEPRPEVKITKGIRRANKWQR